MKILNLPKLSFSQSEADKKNIRFSKTSEIPKFSTAKSVVIYELNRVEDVVKVPKIYKIQSISYLIGLIAQKTT